MQIPELLEKATWADLGLLVALVAAALAARAVTLYGLIPMLSFAGIAKPIDRDHKLVMLWGGMRGAVSLALALAAAENTALPPEVRQFVGILATGFVLFTLLVTAPTMRPLMRLLKISSLAPAEARVSERVIGLSLSLDPAGDRDGRAPASDLAGNRRRGRQSLRRAASATRRAAVQKTPSSRSSSGEQAALYVLVDREQEFCLEYFESRTVSRRVAASLLAHAARLRDGVRSDGIEGYQKAAARIQAFNLPLRLSSR